MIALENPSLRPRDWPYVPSGSARRAVPVLDRYYQQLLASAEFAGSRLLIGGGDPAPRNVTSPLVAALSGGTGLPRLDTSRLRATWLAETAALIGLPAFMHGTQAGSDVRQNLPSLGPQPHWQKHGGLRFGHG
jgi:hypothetical protein